MKTNTVTNWMVVDADGFNVFFGRSRAEVREMKNMFNTSDAIRRAFFGVDGHKTPFRIAKTVVTK